MTDNLTFNAASKQKAEIGATGQKQKTEMGQTRGRGKLDGATPTSLGAETDLARSLPPSLPEDPLRLIPYSTSASRFGGSIQFRGMALT